MALLGDAVMVIYCDFDGDPAEHDDWHTWEHLHERLSIPGFLRATRWVARSGSPRWMILYEVTGVDLASSDAYLARLNAPTPWTTSIMGRLRGMVRGFATIAGSAGFGLGTTALSLRFVPAEGHESQERERLVSKVLPRLASRRGMASVHLLQPAPRPPMTKEQSLRGRDAEPGWIVLATAHDPDALQAAAAQAAIAPPVQNATYEMRFVATAAEVARTAPNPPRNTPPETT